MTCITVDRTDGWHDCAATLRTLLSWGLVWCLLLTMAGDAFAAPSSASLNRQYEQAKKELDALPANKKRSAFRDPWLKLAERLLKLHQANPQWEKSADALYDSARALDGLARRADNKNYAAQAIERYTQMVDSYPKSPLADDALFNAAKLSDGVREDKVAAQVLIQRLITSFPEGDTVKEATEYARKLPPAGSLVSKVGANTSGDPLVAPQKKPEEALLKQIAWRSQGGTVRITLTLDRPVEWQMFSYTSDKKLGSPARLVLQLEGAIPDVTIKPGMKVQKSSLQRLRVDISDPGITRLLLDFSKVARFTVRKGALPSQLVIITSASSSGLPKGARLGTTLRSPATKKRTIPEPPKSLAQQLGLSVGTVLLDAGHGGKDPGTSHNGIVERETVLDITKRLGALLQQRGLRVEYTRTDNTWVSLDARVQKGADVHADLMVSVHINANTKKIISGFETYYLSLASNAEAIRVAKVENAMSERKLSELEGLLTDFVLSVKTQESRRMAETVQKATIEHLHKKGYNTKDGGTKSAPFHVLLGSGVPGILVEVGYCTNKEEAELLASSAYLDALAEGIAAGIVGYTGALHGQ